MPNVPRLYYRLATAERSLHETVAATEGLDKFRALLKLHNSEHVPIRDAMDALAHNPSAFSNPDMQKLEERATSDPANPYFSYLLTEAYLHGGDAGKTRDAASRIHGQPLKLGQLFAKYGLYGEAIEYLKTASHAQPASDDASYQLASAYFKADQYEQALAILQQRSVESRAQPASLALEGNILARLGGLLKQPGSCSKL